MGFSEAVQWWEESQMRFLVLTSLFIQYFLFVAALLRKRRIPHWFRFLIWLAYKGCDAVVIYALATLFNIHKKDEVGMASAHIDTLWAPILLMHLGGQDGITAYSIEDNENWRRYLLISVSQITVAIYVFRKSWWWSDDRRLLGAAMILLFIPGILKCLEKPWALKNATMTSIMNSPDSRLQATLKTDNKVPKDTTTTHAHKASIKKPLSLDEYVQEASKSVQDAIAKAKKDAQDLRKNTPIAGDAEAKDKYVLKGPLDAEVITNNEDIKLLTVRDLEKRVGDKPYHLFADLGHPYFIRLKNLQEVMAAPKARDMAHGLVRSSLSKAFDRLYTKHNKRRSLAGLLRAAAAVLLTFTAIGLFNEGHRKNTYNHDDVIVTYILLCCTATLELVSAFFFFFFFLGSGHLTSLDDQMSQYNIIEYLARNKNYQSFWSLMSRLGYKDQLDRLWCTEDPEASAGITKLVYDHVIQGWTEYININEVEYTYEFIVTRHEGREDVWEWDYIKTMVGTYRRFNDSRGQRTLMWEKWHRRMEAVKSSMHMPFDESVLLWHLATEFCYFERVDTGSDATRHSRVISNYMAYLLLVKPEMLMPGARRSLFTAAYSELEPSGYVVELEPMETMLESPPKTKDEMARKIIQKVKSTIGSDDHVHRAWELAHELMELARDVAVKEEENLKQKEAKVKADQKKIQEEINKGKEENLTKEQIKKAMEMERNMEKMKEKQLMIDAKKAGDDKMWAVIQGVWVEMLCFSAGRCRGYLHAKSLGQGGEYLSYVWLLLSYMGMETMPEKMQRSEMQVKGDVGGLVKSKSEEKTAKTLAKEANKGDGDKKPKEAKKTQGEGTKPAQAVAAAAAAATTTSATCMENAERGGEDELIEMEIEPEGDRKQAQATGGTNATTSAAAVVAPITGDDNV
ncbi:hypothetical protein HU200_038125 [Digitaria exilis]|uniref:DUF4220 domain-containing protein n=1 Tax=Digitaria exilis TaxID=1010633 RepID=A0A835EJH4_9POAL|nr:hypothetical protein HU200_038125 [Digitaria exilis]CAB3491822.1 unnamed protein product [Digitaria exilis]